MRSFVRTYGTAVVALALSSLVATPVAAHVEYTAEDGAHVDPVEFLVDVLGHPTNAALLAVGGLGALVAVAAYLRLRPLQRDVAVFRTAVSGYTDLLPWLLRLSLGLPLVGAGFGGYFVSPAVVPSDPVLATVARLFQIGLGFALLFGLATRVAAVVGLLSYIGVVVVRPELLLAFEYVPGFVAIVLLGSGRPSADNVLETVASAEGTVYGTIDPIHEVTGSVRDLVAPYRDHVPTIVRVGLGVNFVFLGLAEKLLAPGLALAVVEKYDLTAVVPVDPGMWVVGAAFAEIALGTALVLGAFVRAGSLVALLMFTLTLFGLPDDPVLAHVSLFGLASTLLVTGGGPWSIDRAMSEWFSTPSGDTESVPEEVDPTGD